MLRASFLAGLKHPSLRQRVPATVANARTDHLELAVHDPVRLRESCTTAVAGEIGYLLAVTEVGVSDRDTLNVGRRQHRARA